MNKMEQVQIEKLTLNIGAGKDEDKLKKGIKLIKNITGLEPIKTFTKKRIPGWGLRPGLPIGCKLTLRKQAAREAFSRLIKARDNRLEYSQIDDCGNIAFGIHEYIDVPNLKYDPDIGIMGFQVCLTLRRNGYRIKNRKIGKMKLPPKLRITRQEAIDFMKNEFNVTVEDEK